MRFPLQRRSRKLRASTAIARRLACVAVAAGALASSWAVRADVLQDWRNAINYPARISAVFWGDTRLDANSPVRFGAWTIQFRNRTCVAAYQTTSTPPLQYIHICAIDPDKTMKCSNAVAGEQNCYLQFWLTGDKACHIDVFTGTGLNGISNFRELDIPCPTALELAR